MINKTYLFEKLLSYCKNIQGVDEQVLDAHLQKHGLTLRADHRSFLLKYGNSTELLKFGFGDCTYALFEECTSNPQEHLSGFDELPDGAAFFGVEFTSGVLCIDDQSGKIYDYESKELSECLYENIDTLLFFCLSEYLWSHKEIVVNSHIIIKKEEIAQFFQQHEAYHLTGLDNFFTTYFLKNNQLIYCRKSQNIYEVDFLQGEVLNSIADGGLLFKG